MTMKRTKFNIRTIAVTGMLGALATVLMFLEFPIPMLIPPFIKFDFSELPALLAAYAMGPVSGIAVCFIKNAINLLHTQTGGVGELSNFILGVCFVLPAGLIYKRKKNTEECNDRSISRSSPDVSSQLYFKSTLLYIQYTQTSCQCRQFLEHIRRLTRM